jgi:hypothetical protein
MCKIVPIRLLYDVLSKANHKLNLTASVHVFFKKYFSTCHGADRRRECGACSTSVNHYHKQLCIVPQLIIAMRIVALVHHTTVSIRADIRLCALGIGAICHRNVATLRAPLYTEVNHIVYNCAHKCTYYLVYSSAL